METKWLLIIVALALIFCLSKIAYAEGRERHIAASAALATGLTVGCRAAVKDRLLCGMVGGIATYTLMSLIEAMQRGRDDEDFISNGIGTGIGVSIGLALPL